jgi:hypothetical protein
MIPNDLKSLIEPTNAAMAMLQKTLNGLPDRISAFENIKADEAKIMAETLTKINGIMSDIAKETEAINKAAQR